jgi:hypothetical protein
VYDTKYCLFGVMCCVAPLSKYQLSASTLFAPEAPITCTRNPSTFVFAVDLPPLSPACCCFWGHSAAQWPSCLHLLHGNFCFARLVPLFVDLLEFIFVEFDFFLSLSCATNTVASTDVYFSAGNSTARSFSMSIFIFLFIGMVFQTVLILSYSLRSVDKNSSSQLKFRQRVYTMLRKFIF